MQMRLTCNRWLAIAVCAFFAVLASKTSDAAVEPDNVKAEITRAAAECRRAGGQPSTLSMARVDDLNGDGAEDWILDYAKLRCTGQANPFCGPDGCTLKIYLWSGPSTWQLAFDQPVMAYRYVREGRRLNVQVAGSACGMAQTKTCLKTYLIQGKGIVARGVPQPRP